MLMTVLCDREGRVYDVWISFGSVHEVFVRNELGDWDIAFKICHAKIGDSGYSFGPPQWDLKTNGETMGR